jgi:hypothetical protein
MNNKSNAIESNCSYDKYYYRLLAFITISCTCFITLALVQSFKASPPKHVLDVPVLFDSDLLQSTTLISRTSSSREALHLHEQKEQLSIESDCSNEKDYYILSNMYFWLS